MMTKNQLTLALVRCGLVDPRAVDDPEDYDDCATVGRISELHASLQLFARSPADPVAPQWDINSIERIARQQGVFGGRDGDTVTITGPIVIKGPSLNRRGNRDAEIDLDE